MSDWRDGQCPDRVWLAIKDVGAHPQRGKKPFPGYRKLCRTRLLVGDVECWTHEPSHKPKEYVEYRLVRRKRK